MNGGAMSMSNKVGYDITKDEFIEIPEHPKDVAARKNSKDSISQILEDRGKRYGKFVDHARITQELKKVMKATDNWVILKPDQVEALEMVAHKIGRILNGDPDYADSWDDIAGYAKLVGDRLNGKIT